ncbi:MAG: mandelate racemase/muconate lactonizing enzyme family protein [Chloroflexi bacterium]|nr:mandelate racemase/muconate lactonizing enzyme family protein [Chloroflexota bacterium]
MSTQSYDEALNHVSTYSAPSQLRITDIRVTTVKGAPMTCPIIKVYTNQGLVGYGEVRDGASKTYALLLKGRLLGENPCHVDRLFRRIKQFGHHGRQGGGVSGLEVALWDLAGKAYGVPIYQMLGGKFRDQVRVYCDTDMQGKPDGAAMGRALKARMDKGFTFLKMDVGIWPLIGTPGALTAPLGFFDRFTNPPAAPDAADPWGQIDARNRSYDYYNIAHAFTGVRVTERGLDLLAEYVSGVRGVIGYDVPLAADHFGHISLGECIKIAQRLDPFNLAWYEDMLPWQLTDQYVQLAQACRTPICTGEDTYLKEGFRPLLESGGVAVIHPDILTCGGILEMKKIGDLAQEHSVAFAMHMAESPIGCMACVHAAAASEQFLALENHSVDVPWWDDLVVGPRKPIIQQGYITVPDGPGLGIESLNEELIAEHRDPSEPESWAPTPQWDDEYCHDRLWS